MILSVTRWTKQGPSSFQMPAADLLEHVVATNNANEEIPPAKFDKQKLEDYIGAREPLVTAYLAAEPMPSNYRVASDDGNTVYSVLCFSTKVAYDTYLAEVAQGDIMALYELVRNEVGVLFELDVSTFVSGTTALEIQTAETLEGLRATPLSLED